MNSDTKGFAILCCMFLGFAGKWGLLAAALAIIAVAFAPNTDGKDGT